MTHILRSVAAVGIRGDALPAYLELHRHQPDAVREAMLRSHILTYRMYLLKSQSIVVSVSERQAATVIEDRRQMNNDPVMQDWLKTCRAMQIALPGERNEPPLLWSPLPEVYSLLVP